MATMAYVWLAVAVALAILEGGTFSLVSIWFVGGAVAAFFAAVFGGGIVLQLTLFVVVSAVLLAALRPLAIKRAKIKPSRTNADRIIGTIAVVTERISNIDGAGAVKVSGMEWTARSESDEVIETGTQVKILRIAGVKVFVEPAQLPVEVQ